MRRAIFLNLRKNLIAKKKGMAEAIPFNKVEL
jgi:hypothetical protein